MLLVVTYNIGHAQQLRRSWAGFSVHSNFKVEFNVLKLCECRISCSTWRSSQQSVLVIAKTRVSQHPGVVVVSTITRREDQEADELSHRLPFPRSCTSTVPGDVHSGWRVCLRPFNKNAHVGQRECAPGRRTHRCIQRQAPPIAGIAGGTWRQGVRAEPSACAHVGLRRPIELQLL